MLNVAKSVVYGMVGSGDNAGNLTVPKRPLIWIIVGQ